ncbi:MAG: hydroxyacid dehydrogenase [Defluviitaleaceae bacterium]|nr:hydroxyacid dehydrogenase [Defluviitaleaceae bacterium]
MNILVMMPQGPTRESFIPEWVVQKLAAIGTVQYNQGTEHYTKPELYEAIKDKDVCITGWGTARIDPEFLDAAPKLRMIAHTGGTVAPYVDEEVYRCGIKVASGNAIYARSVAEGVLAYILCSLRQLPRYNNMLHTGGWSGTSDINAGLFNKRVGIVGFGAIARNVLDFLRPFNVEILVNSGHLTQEDAAALGVKKASLEEVFSGCDIISIHSAQRKENDKMVNDTLLSMIKPGGLFINTARGSIVDEEALIKHLKAGRFNAVLDVFSQEPLPVDSPLRGLDNAILIPHMAGPTIDLRPYVTSTLADDIVRFAAGEALVNEIPWSYAQHMTSGHST